MATFVDDTFTQLAAGAVNGARSFDTPTGAASGDRIIVAIKISHNSGAIPSLTSIPAGWVQHSIDNQDEPFHVTPANMTAIVISGIHDGVSSSYSVTIADAYQTAWGGNIQALAYSGDVDVLETTFIFDPDADTSKVGPTDVAATGETCVAIMMSGASTGPLPMTWGGGFTERTEQEYYGISAFADANGSGASLTPTITTSGNASAMFTMLRLGVEVNATTFVAYSYTEFVAGAVNGARSFSTPLGTQSGDLIIASIRVSKTSGGSNPSLSSIPSGWTQLSAQTTDDNNQTPDIAQFVISGPHDGSSTSYSVTIADAYQTAWGGNIQCVSYTGDVDILETTTGLDTDVDTSKVGPSDDVAIGEFSVTCFAGSAWTITPTWGGGYTERVDDEWYGENTIADAPGAGGTLTPTLTLIANSTGIFTLIRLGSSLFPNTGILDYFTGADENPITTNWTCPIYPGDGNLQRVSNQLVDTGGAFSNGWYDLAQYGPDCEAWVTIVTKPTTGEHVRLFARCKDVGTTSLDGYMVAMVTDAGTDIVRIENIVDGLTINVLGAAMNLEFAAGDGLGIRCVGDQIEAWHRSGGIWSLLGARTDTTFTNAGYFGIEVTPGAVVLDNFGGGDVVVSQKQSFYVFRRRSWR